MFEKHSANSPNSKKKKNSLIEFRGKSQSLGRKFQLSWRGEGLKFSTPATVSRFLTPETPEDFV